MWSIKTETFEVVLIETKVMSNFGKKVRTHLWDFFKKRLPAVEGGV